MKRFAVVAVAVVLSAASLPARAEDKMLESPYYPLQVGNSWTYTGQNAGVKMTITNKVAKHEKVGDTLCARLEYEVDGKVVGHEHLAVQKDGIYRYSMNGQTLDKPIKILTLPPKKGDTWDIAVSVNGTKLTGKGSVTEEKVEVKAGKYDTVVSIMTLEAEKMKVEATNHYAKDVGLVKTSAKNMGFEVVLELEKFTPGK